MAFLIEIEVEELCQVNEVVSLLLDQQRNEQPAAVRIHEVDEVDLRYMKKEVE